MNEVKNKLSYFFTDNSEPSFLSGEALSALFGSLLCAVPELRFLGGILVPGYLTVKRSN